MRFECLVRRHLPATECQSWILPLVGACAVLCFVPFSTRAAGAPGADGLFTKHCAPCHGKDGKAQSPAARKLGVKDLSESKATDAEIAKQITDGRKDDRGNLKMPAFQKKLSAEEIQSLITVVKRFRK